MTTRTKTIGSDSSKPVVDEHEQVPAVSLADLPFVKSEQMRDRGFPYDVPTELTEDAGREVERIMARGAPAWVRKLRDRFGR